MRPSSRCIQTRFEKWRQLDPSFVDNMLKVIIDIVGHACLFVAKEPGSRTTQDKIIIKHVTQCKFSHLEESSKTLFILSIVRGFRG